eukprot:6849558-Pyramimonas_sp.AAC.2
MDGRRCRLSDRPTVWLTANVHGANDAVGDQLVQPGGGPAGPQRDLGRLPGDPVPDHVDGDVFDPVDGARAQEAQAAQAGGQQRREQAAAAVLHQPGGRGPAHGEGGGVAAGEDAGGEEGADQAARQAAR